MEPRKIALIVGGVLFAGIAVFAGKNFMGETAAPPTVAAPKPKPVETGPQILVAAGPLPIGTILGPDSVKFQPWPKEMLNDAYFLQKNTTIDKLVGTVVRESLAAGEPLTEGALVNPGDRGFLAAALSPGMRAVTVEVSKASSAGNLIFPGDRVDVMMTQDTVIAGTQPLRSSETFLENVRVLATDQRTATEMKEGKSVIEKFETVTLEVTPRMAEKIAVATLAGKLSLALRPIADSATELDRAIARGDVSVPDNADATTIARMAKAARARPREVRRSTTGADVSAFMAAAPTPVPSVRIFRGGADVANVSQPNASQNQPNSMAAPAERTVQ